MLSKGNRSPDKIYDADSAPCPTQSAITVQATDNVAVTQVTGTYAAGLPGSPIAFVHGAGNTWTATFGPFAPLDVAYEANVGISIVARDAAGNTSTATVVTVRVLGSCLG